MKKSVVILIAIIYVASIAIVSFFGMDFEIFDEVVYVTEVKLTNDGLKPGNQNMGDYYVFVRPDENGTYSYQLEVSVLPSNASNKKVDYVYSENPAVSIDENGLVTFSGYTEPVTIYIVSTDGSNVKTSITIICR